MRAKVVQATGIAANVRSDKGLSKILEKAMSDEVQRCMDEGIADPVKQRQRILEARDKALNEHRG